MTKSTQTASPNAARYGRLRMFNLIVGLIFVLQVAAMVKLNKAFDVPLVLSYLKGQPGSGVLPKAPTEIFTLNLGICVAIFLACAALDHLLVGTLIRGWYERQMESRANYARWIEYTFSSSLMVVLIVVVVGVRDLGAIIAIIAANSAMILFGLLMERKEVPGETDWSAFWFSSVVGLAPWLIVIFYITHASPPGFVYGILITQFLLFFSFALNMGLQYKQVGKWKDYIYGEYVYISLSIGAKTLLAWLIFANVIRPGA